VDRIKRLSYEVLDKHKSKFNDNFADNKKQLESITIIRSKGLKNEIAGYITKFIKKEQLEQELKQSQDYNNDKSESIQEEIEAESSQESEGSVIEVGVDEINPEESAEPVEDKQE